MLCYVISCGIPQGSVLGPLLFNLYMLPFARVIHQYNICFHQYADDMRLLSITWTRLLQFSLHPFGLHKKRA